jgi:tmRNA-binding protein
VSLQIELYSTAESKNNFIFEFSKFPNTLYADDGKVKKLPYELEAMFARVKTLYDKRQTLREQAVQREVRQMLKRSVRR